MSLQDPDQVALRLHLEGGGRGVVKKIFVKRPIYKMFELVILISNLCS